MFSPTHSEVLALVQAAVWAPSADNEHHLQFVLREDGLEVRSDDFFAKCTAGHRRLLTLLSYGAVGENLRLKLADLGWTYEPAWFPERDDAGLLLRIVWNGLRPGARRDPLVDDIATRHTNRAFFRGPALSPVEKNAIDAAGEAVASTRLTWFDDPSRRRALLRLMRIAETGRFATRRHHQEMFGSIAFDAGWKTSTRLHIAAGSLAIERPLQPAFAALRSWPLMRTLNRVGAHRAIGFRAGDLPGRLAPHLVVVSSTLPSEGAAIAGGAALQRVWLAAQAAGLALQPMAASAILTDDLEGDTCGPSSALAQRLRVGWHPLIGDDRPLMVFRLGRAPKPSVRSLRLAPEHYVRKTTDPM